MKLRFTKMHRLGKDFIVLGAIGRNFVPALAQVRSFACFDHEPGLASMRVIRVETQSSLPSHLT
ncbi:MAG: hypothetical protein Q8O52_09710 [Sulfuritalea sp.]|nr:hypothetical protein [Sulfuritalea sp.]